MSSDGFTNKLTEEEPREIRQAFGWLNPIFRTLSFLPLLLAFFGLLGALALRSQQGFLVTYSRPSDQGLTKEWAGKSKDINFINETGYFLPPEFSETDYFLRFRARLPIEKDGIYRFILESDDASWLFIDGRQVLDNGGRHLMLRKEVSVHLSPGLHDIQIDYRQFDLEHILKLRWKTPDMDSPEVVGSSSVLLPHSAAPAISLGTQRALSFVGVILLLVQVWALVVIVACFPQARNKMAARLALILILGLMALGQYLMLAQRWSEGVSGLDVTGYTTQAIAAFLEKPWGLKSCGFGAAFVMMTSALVGIQYRLGKDLFASRIVGISASLALGITIAVLTGQTVAAGQSLVFHVESLVLGCLALLFAWRLGRQMKIQVLDVLLLVACVALGTDGYVGSLPFWVGSAVLLLGRFTNKYSLEKSTRSALWSVIAVATILAISQVASHGFGDLLRSPTSLANVAIGANLLIIGMAVRRSHERRSVER